MFKETWFSNLNMKQFGLWNRVAGFLRSDIVCIGVVCFKELACVSPNTHFDYLFRHLRPYLMRTFTNSYRNPIKRRLCYCLICSSKKLESSGEHPMMKPIFILVLHNLSNGWSCTSGANDPTCLKLARLKSNIFATKVSCSCASTVAMQSIDLLDVNFFGLLPHRNLLNIISFQDALHRLR